MRLIDADVLKQHIDKLPALPDGNFAGNHSALKALINMQPTIESSTNCSEIQNSSDCISRQAAIDALMPIYKSASLRNRNAFSTARKCMAAIEDLPSAQPEQRWIPFKTRPLTEEEKEEHPEWDCILDCKLPDNGQRILVAIRVRGHEEVQQDEFYSDDGSYLDSGYEIGTEAVAWMPLPEPYKEDDHETD